MCCYCVVVFFKQKTAYEMRISDWSSDVCSSDLAAHELLGVRVDQKLVGIEAVAGVRLVWAVHPVAVDGARSCLGEVAVPDLVGVLGQLDAPGQIGRASCRERVCQYV